MSTENSQINNPHQYMTIETERRDGEIITNIRVSKYHPDEPCDCEEPHYDGEDVHDDIRMRFKVTFLRITDQAGLLEQSQTVAGDNMLAFSVAEPEDAS